MKQYALGRNAQRCYRAWYKNLEETSGILVFPKRAPGVALPHDGPEHGSNFVIPEPSPRRVVIEITKYAGDVSANADSDVSADDTSEDVDPLGVSIPNTPVASPVDTSVIEDEMDDSVSVGASSST